MYRRLVSWIRSAGRSGGRGVGLPSLLASSRVFFHIRLCRRVKIWFRKFRSQDWFYRNRDFAFRQSLVEASVEITTDHSLHRNHLQLSNNHPIRIFEPDHVVWRVEIVEPERC